MRILDENQIELIQNAILTYKSYYFVEHYACQYITDSNRDWLCIFGDEITQNVSAGTFTTSSGYSCRFTFHTQEDDTFSSNNKVVANCDLKSPSSKSFSSSKANHVFSDIQSNGGITVDIIAKYSTSTIVDSSSSSDNTSLDLSPITTYLFLISSVLMLIYITNFIKSCFKRRS